MKATKQTKKTSQKVDWNKAYIIAALHVEGVSLRSLSTANGYAATTLANTIRNPWPAGERIIAAAIKENPWSIWPSRYGDDNKPLSGRGQRKAIGQGRHVKRNGNTVKSERNGNGNGAS